MALWQQSFMPKNVGCYSTGNCRVAGDSSGTLYRILKRWSDLWLLHWLPRLAFSVQRAVKVICEVPSQPQRTGIPTLQSLTTTAAMAVR